MLKKIASFSSWEKKSPSLQDIYKRWSTVINSICFNKWRLYSDLYFSCLGFSIFNHYARFDGICCWHSAPQGTISREVNLLGRQQIFSLCSLKWQERAQLAGLSQYSSMAGSERSQTIQRSAQLHKCLWIKYWR